MNYWTQEHQDLLEKGFLKINASEYGGTGLMPFRFPCKRTLEENNSIEEISKKLKTVEIGKTDKSLKIEDSTK